MQPYKLTWQAPSPLKSTQISRGIVTTWLTVSVANPSHQIVWLARGIRG